METSKFSFGSRCSISLIIFQTIFIVFTTTNFAIAWNKFIVNNTNDAGPGSLRQAILDANARTGTDTIAFDISGAGPHTTRPTSALPTIIDPVVIDGLTQPGASCDTWPPTLLIELTGTNAGNANGLRITAGNSTIRGLVINRFVQNGIFIGVNGGNVIENNFIGTDITGTADLGNTVNGVLIQNESSNNRIGGIDSTSRNVISGNDFAGVNIFGGTRNLIQGNYIGTDLTGTTIIRNNVVGVTLQNGATNTTIGGTEPGAGNVISGNGNDNEGGVTIISNSNNNFVKGNYIGTDVTGTKKLGNTGVGIYMVGAFDNMIGGMTINERNIISGNSTLGILISGNNAAGNKVQGNFIGTDITGSNNLGNSLYGIRIHSGAYNNIIGGTNPEACNIISFNGFDGVCVLSGFGNRIQSNSFFSNMDLGIDLGTNGITPNDPGDIDVGPNNLQNFPEIMSVGIDDNNDLLISYWLDCEPSNSTYPLNIQFFKSDARGQGKTLLFNDDFKISDFNSNGKIVNIGNASELGIILGDSIVATATDCIGNTSEFSSVVIVVEEGEPWISVLPMDTLNFGQVFIGFPDTMWVKVTNIGDDTLHATDISITGDGFTANLDTFMLGYRESYLLSVVFNPTFSQVYSGNLSITSNDPNNPVVIVALQGEGLLPSEITVSPDSLREDLYTGQISTQVLTIQNTGGSDLAFNISTKAKTHCYALQFDGINDYVDCGDSEALKPNQYTIEAWVNIPSPQLAWNYGSFVIGKEFNTSGYGIAIGSREPAIYHSDGSGWYRIHSNVNISLNEWHHIAGSYDGSTVKIYVDGSLRNMANHQFANTNLNLFIGAWNDGGTPSRLFKGTIDEVRIWNIARTEAEIQADMHRELTGSESGLAAYWCFNEGMGTIAFDKTPHGNTGTLHNGVSWIVSTTNISPGWVSTTPVSGNVVSGSSLDITVKFDATCFYGGDHNGDIVINNNDPDEPEVIIPAHLNVTGAANISVDSDTMDFSQVFLGVTKSLEVVVRNNGTEDLLISKAETKPVEYVVSPSFAGIDPGQNEVFTVSFSPQTEGDYPGMLTFTSNDPNKPALTIVLQGKGVLPPEISVSPDSLSEDLFTGDSLTQVLTINNIGGSDLTFDISTNIFFGSSRYNSALHFDGVDDYVAINVPGTNQQLTISLWFKLDTRAGTYNTLYRSTERNNPALGGTGILFLENDKLGFSVDLGGEFNLRSSTSIAPEKWYHAAVVWDNVNEVRKIYVDGVLTGQVNYTPGPLQIGEAEIGGLLAWGGWYFKGTIDEVRIWNKACTLAEIRTDMHREIDGDTPGLMAYYRFNEGTGNTTFDQTPNGYHATLNRGVTWLPSTTPTIPWLSVAPTSGTLAAGSSMELDVGFDATALFGGNYLAEIIITSNEPDEPILPIPVELEVSGRPVFSIAVDTVDFGTSFGGFSDSLYLRMTNDGTDTLKITNLVSGDPRLTFTPSALTIPPLAEDSLALHLSVEREGVFTTSLSFSTNDPDVGDVSLPVKAKVLIAPSISVSQDSIHEHLSIGGSSTQKMTISNQGGSDLLFDALVTSPKNYALKFDGIDDYVQIVNPSTINGNADFTWSAWIKTGSQVPIAIMAKTINGFTGGVKTFYIGSDGALAFHVAEAGAAWGIKPVNDNQWHHVAVTVNFNGAAAFRFYVDGVYDNQGQLSNAGSYSEEGFQFQIGYDGRFPGTLFPFSGMIDEVRIWNKVRSLAEIQSDMHREISGTEPGLVACWRFNETSGNIAFDQTPNAHDGSLQGGVMLGPSTAFSPSWLSVTPASGTIAVGSSQDLELAFNASHLAAGVVNADIVVVNNDPNKPEIRVPVRLDVISTGVEEYSDGKTEVPKNYVLFQNFPNPFNPVTHIRFGLPKAGNVKIELYNIRGECVKQLLAAQKSAGYHIVDVDGGQLASGVYFCRIQADNFLKIKKMILLK